jgi:APA family basic amino acid/polyamine antiporter
LIFALPRHPWLPLAVWLIVGLAIYFFYGRNHSHLAEHQDGAMHRL